MEASDSMQNLCDTASMLERQNAQLTAPWYTGEVTSHTEIDSLIMNIDQSVHTLEALSKDLNARLHRMVAQNEQRAHVQYAYNLTQELLQSRQASRELLDTLKHQPEQRFAEYYRAVAIKEKAAKTQTSQLTQTVRQIH